MLSAGRNSSRVGVDSEAPGMVVRGLPVDRTLGALAALASRMQRANRCAILVLEDSAIKIAAEHGLQPADRTLLHGLTAFSDTHTIAEFALAHSIDLRALVTQAAELIGWVALFGSEPLDQGFDEKELEEVCWIATLAIEQKHLLEEVAYQAHHDALTHLWNRVWMDEEIDRVFGTLARVEGYVGLAQIGIDSFRVINDVLGHQVGNELLRQIAGRLSASLRPSFSLARGSGDEFMVLMPGVSPSEQLAVSHDLLKPFEEAFQIGDHELIVRATVGVTAIALGTCTAAELQSQSNIALHYAKRRARGRIVSFEPSMMTVPPERLVMEQHMRFASHKREFQLY